MVQFKSPGLLVTLSLTSLGFFVACPTGFFLAERALIVLRNVSHVRDCNKLQEFHLLLADSVAETCSGPKV